MLVSFLAYWDQNRKVGVDERSVSCADIYEQGKPFFPLIPTMSVMRRGSSVAYLCETAAREALV